MLKQVTSFCYNVAYASNFNKPRLMQKLFLRTISSRLSGVPRLRYADLCVTAACNLKCEHCFSENFKDRSDKELSWRQKELDLEEWKAIIRSCKDAGVLSFGITGGEPLLYDKLYDLIGLIGPSDSYITINSNGILFTEQRARELKELGVDAMLFSLDSADAEFHDRFRGLDNAFEKTLEAVRTAQKYRFKVCVVCTVSHENIKSKGVISLIELTKKIGVMMIISRAAPVGRWRGHLNVLLDENERDYMYGLVKKYPHTRTDFETNILKYGCSAGTEKIYITPYGDVLPCPFMHISFGNILKTPIETIRGKIIKELGCYAQKCYVAENKDFINKHLSKTFDQPSVAIAEDCF